MGATADLQSVPGVCEVRLVAPPDAPDRPARLLIELPHGATTESDFLRVARRLRGDLPADLDRFFFVNTDAGAPECASRIARRLIELGSRVGGGVLVVRCEIPRTFIDTNRVVDGRPSGEVRSGVTPGLPAYVTDGADAELLVGLHRRYHEVAGAAYERVCGVGGLALTLHTYAPKAVEIDRIDGDIVRRLHEAYRPGTYERWADRPEVDVISETGDGARIGPERLIDALVARYAEAGIAVSQNATYRLVPSTMGFVYSERHPGRVLCVELSRGALADPFVPFRELSIGEARVARMTEPMVAAVHDVLGELE